MNRDTKDFNDDSLMGEKSHFHSEIDWLNEEINHLEKENNQLSEYLDKLRAEYSTVVPNLQDELERLNQKIDELEREKELLGKGNQAKRGYQLDIVDLEENVVDMKAKISDLEDLNKKHIERLKDDKFTIAKLEHEIENLNQVLGKIENEMESKVYMLNKEIVELEQKNKESSIDADKIKPLTDYIDKLENTIAEFKDKIDNLELENKKLREIVATEEYSQIPSIVEENILRLQKRVAELIQDNLDLTEKNQILLKAALLLDVDVEAVEDSDEMISLQIDKPPQIPQGEVQDLVNKSHAATDLEEISEELEEIPEELEEIHEELEELPEELEELPEELEELPEELEELPEELKELPVEVEELIGEIEEFFGEFEDKPLEVAAEYDTEEHEKDQEGQVPIQTTTTEASEFDADILNVEEIIMSGDRRTCPICGNQDKRLIREMIDRTNVISAFAGLYGKKYKCGKCGTEWH